MSLVLGTTEASGITGISQRTVINHLERDLLQDRIVEEILLERNLEGRRLKTQGWRLSAHFIMNRTLE